MSFRKSICGVCGECGKCGEKIGWSETQIANYMKIIKEIFTSILDLCKKHQSGRVNKNFTSVNFDLFDWLQIINKLRVEGLTQKEIGEKIGWSRGQISQYQILLEKIATPILDLCKEHQNGRVSQKATVVAFDFSEGWFRTSGLYDLNEKYQLDCLERFIADKCHWSKNLLGKETAKYRQWQKFIGIAKEKLVAETNLEKLIKLIENNVFSDKEQLMDKITSLNKDSKNKLICGDALLELPKLDDDSIDLVIIEHFSF